MTQGRSISLIVHADSKVGKSTLGNTTPAPRLLLDSEMGYRFLPGTKVFWDPMTQSPPEYDGSWETCVVLVREYAVMKQAYEWLNSGQHPFRSVTIDSISELQTKLRDKLIVDGTQGFDLWGSLLIDMEKLVRQLRDLTEHPTKPLEAVVLTAMTQMRNGKWRPYVQGQLQTKLPYFLDVIGYMYVEQVQDTQDPTKLHKVRRMLVTPHVQYEAGERVQGRLGEVVDNPTVTGMLDMVFGPITTTEESSTND